jgi:hypothetical protein
MKAQFGPFLLAAALGACDVPATPPSGQGSTTPAYQRAEQRALDPGTVPVRVGELGPSFPACYAIARFRDRVVADEEPVPVRAAPFEQARETARIPADGQFFICTRSHDQRWFAVVWDAAGGASRSCGVSHPASSRRDYDGPCRSGWLSSAVVRLESGIRHADAPPANAAAPAAAPPSVPAER